MALVPFGFTVRVELPKADTHTVLSAIKNGLPLTRTIVHPDRSTTFVSVSRLRSAPKQPCEASAPGDDDPFLATITRREQKPSLPRSVEVRLTLPAAFLVKLIEQTIDQNPTFLTFGVTITLPCPLSLEQANGLRDVLRGERATLLDLAGTLENGKGRFKVQVGTDKDIVLHAQIPVADGGTLDGRFIIPNVDVGRQVVLQWLDRALENFAASPGPKPLTTRKR